MREKTTRRQLLIGTGAGLGAAAVGVSPAVAAWPDKADHGFGYALNIGTIRGQKLGLVEQIEVAARTGYDGIEPWTGDINKYAQSGGSLKDVGKRCKDLGLKVISAIGFARWLANDDAARAKGMEDLARDMDGLAQIGGTHIAAPPAGANRPGTTLDLDAAAERYHAICELGRKTGVIPQIEVWGPSANLSHGAEALYVAAKSGHPDACVLLDTYHMYKGGTPVSVLKLLGRTAMHAFHINDYPADPPRETIRDSHRVMPGDGVAPNKQILAHLAANHCRVYLSLELFSKTYWEMPAMEAAKIGLDKMKKCVAAAGLR